MVVQFVVMAGDDGGGTSTQPPLLIINSGTRANSHVLSPIFFAQGLQLLVLASEACANHSLNSQNRFA